MARVMPDVTHRLRPTAQLTSIQQKTFDQGISHRNDERTLQQYTDGGSTETSTALLKSCQTVRYFSLSYFAGVLKKSLRNLQLILGISSAACPVGTSSLLLAENCNASETFARVVVIIAVFR